MLNRLSFHRFKSWEHVADMRLAPITGLFGPNSSGKTSIAQLLLLLKQTAESPDRAQVINFGDDRTLVSLGTFREVLYKHDISEPLSFGLEWTRDEPLEIADPARQRHALLFSSSRLAFSASISATPDGTPTVDSFRYSLGDQAFELRRSRTSRTNYELLPTKRGLAGGFRFIRTQGRKWPLPAPVKCYGFPDQVKAYFQNAGFVSELELALEHLLSHTYYLGPLREYPRRQYIWGGGEPEDVGHRGELVVDALLASRSRGRQNYRGYRRRRVTLEEHIADWLRTLGLIHKFTVEEIERGGNLYRVRVQVRKNSEPVLITDVGFGVSQLLPVIVLCFYVPRGSIVLLEQPEIHLHPAVQAGLADILIQAVQARGLQIIVESHSEYLLQRLQRRIAEAVIEPNDVALYFCELRDGRSTLLPLEVDVLGNVINWPDGFFGDSFEEMAAMAEAGLRRRQDFDD